MRYHGIIALAVAGIAPKAMALASDPSPIFSNKAGFRIPYHYDAQEISKLGAREIRLFTSVDRGVNWRHIQSVTPTAGKFEFRAPSDGEYWFSVQTLDAQKNLHPGGTMAPGLIVIVDSQEPRLDITLQEREPGKVELAWNATDSNLAPETMKLEFTQSGQNDWQPVGATPTATGRTSWSLPAGGYVSVKGQVQDRAGNVGRSQYQISIRGGATNPGLNSPMPAVAVPPAGPVAGLSSPGSLFGPTPQLPVDPPRPMGADAWGLPTASNSSSWGSPSPKTTGFPSGAPQFGNAVQTNPGSSGMPFTVGFPSGSPSEQGAYFSQVSERGGQRAVNSRRFQLNYRVDDVGPSGVGMVELYITQNNGQKWFRYGVDEDRRSPFEIEVPGDGLYGFIIRVVSGAGQADPPPQPGQRPDVVVTVDSTPPTVQLFPLRQGQGRDSNKILITWQAGDQQLSDAPIALSYSSDPNGPWEPIGGWQSNTGNYVWNIGANVPPRLYVRLIARDSAGNLAKVDTPQPVLVDLAKPSARIVDVESSMSPRGLH